MRSLPEPDQFGSWDKLPAKVEVKNPEGIMIDLVERRDGLAEQHKNNLDNTCAVGRNWALRQNYEGYCALNNRIRALQESIDLEVDTATSES